MIDDAWIDEVERRAMPLRVVLPPWGEVLAREALRAPPREPAPRSRRWMIAVVAGAAAAVAAWVWPRHETRVDSPTMQVREHMTAAPPVVTRPPAEITPPPIAAPIEDQLASSSEEPADPQPRPRVRRRARRPPVTELVENDAPTIDCILDPSLCRAPKTGRPQDDLPETLGTTEIKRGIDGIRPLVRDCALTHGAIPKQKVTIKFTISGETGMVTQANIVTPKLSVGLEQCIIAAMHRASFGRFRKERLGVMFPLKMP